MRRMMPKHAREWVRDRRHSRPQRKHYSTPTPSKHGMDFSMQNRVLSCKNEPQKPLIWQPKASNT
ncbi:hypothetical protein HYC85_029281 [Camellia sinensis]|uniref:Uncharacterized protein n=1 Tax=Camellia sinensis TaxID=4442 RepID=A0A7J7FXK2_CAMSI|nr:hypothetical protein HYC85_029281 [Camellia sinensis]